MLYQQRGERMGLIQAEALPASGDNISVRSLREMVLPSVLSSPSTYGLEQETGWVAAERVQEGETMASL